MLLPYAITSLFNFITYSCTYSVFDDNYNRVVLVTQFTYTLLKAAKSVS